MRFLLPSIASSALDPACFLDFNVNGDRSAIHGANAQPQPQRPMRNEELAEEEEAGGADDGDTSTTTSLTIPRLKRTHKKEMKKY